jgi:hypothetical protein
MGAARTGERLMGVNAAGPHPNPPPEGEGACPARFFLQLPCLL